MVLCQLSFISQPGNQSTSQYPAFEICFVTADPPMRPLPPDESPKTPEVPVPERDPYKPLPGREPERRTEESPAVEPQVEPQPLREK